MKKNDTLKPIILFLIILAALLMSFSCEERISETSEIATNIKKEDSIKNSKPELSNEFKSYWYSGEAEITSYELEQARYGEIHEGTAMLVFVTEDFLPKTQVKAENYDSSNISVLKLNATKNFNTGIYPYSIMQSTFFPVANNQHALKIAASIQEWCGQVYAQLNNRAMFEVTSHSYFQGEADKSFKLEKTWTENELWTKLRINPLDLPTGQLQIIPSLEFTKLRHKDIKAYEANAKLENGQYTLNYPELSRELTILFNPKFPHSITGWEEKTISGFGANTEVLTTKATKLKTLKTAYWNKNKKSDHVLRDSLLLK
jgi:hypothetical protein